MKRLFLTLFFAALTPLSVLAQEDAGRSALHEPGTVWVHNSLLPVVAYQSDAGLIGGLVWQRLAYGEDPEPFAGRSTAEITLSTRAHLSAKAEFERMRTFGAPVRSRFRLELFRIPNRTYFGTGNDSVFDRESYQDGVYEYLDRSLRLYYWGRMRLLDIGSRGGLDLQLQLVLASYHPGTVGDETLFEQHQPAGYSGGWANRVGGGLILDGRDSEFNPTRGYRVEATLSGAGSMTLSDYRFGTFRAEGRHYLSLAGWLVLAQRLEYHQALGTPPFQELPVLGNEMGLRGYALDRFRDHGSLLHQAELRAWVLSVLDDEIRLGGQIFMDTGRVFAREESFAGGFTGLRNTFGVGGVFSFLNPDVIFRADVGFSDELYRVYIGIGYLF